MEQWLQITWMVLGILVVTQIQLSHLLSIALSGPNVCGIPSDAHCCPGWKLHPTLNKCFWPSCIHDCGEGYCKRPNVCYCIDGQHSTTGCVSINKTEYEDSNEFEFIESGTFYGKNDMRIMRMHRAGDIYFIREFEVNINLKLYKHNEYTRGDNSDVIATDTQKNRVYALAKEKGIDSAEQFALDICQSHIDAYIQVVSCNVYIEESPWRRMHHSAGESHAHAFIRTHEGIRFTELVLHRNQPPQLWGGLKEMRILKATQSGFANFYRDNFTSLPETTDRVLSTVVWCKWLYSGFDGINFDQTWEMVKSITLDVFAGPPDTGEFSPSVQRTAYKTLHKILHELSEIREVAIEMPNVHYFHANLAKIGIDNNNEVFAPSEMPAGLIRAALRRKFN